MRPVLIIVTGRPGAGKSTLAHRLSRQWHLPLISRDAIKEGYLRTAGKGHALLPESNRAASEAFFAMAALAVERGVSCVAEAAFQHRVWAERLPALAERAHVYLLICRVEADLALERFRARGAGDPSRAWFHGDEAQGASLIAAYEEPHLPLPTYGVDTSCGYTPPLEWLEERILGKAPPQP